jgi:hypothetical protein
MNKGAQMSIQRKLVRLIAPALLTAAAAAPVQAAVILGAAYNDFLFTGAPGVGGSISVPLSGGSSLAAPTQGFDGVGGFSGTFIYNNATGNPAGAVTLSLNNLPAHTAVDVNFLLAFIDSWDSTDGSPAPDILNVEIDGAVVLQVTCNLASGRVCYGGSVVAPRAHYGFNSSFQDIGFDMTNEPALTVPHTSSSLSVRWFASGNGWQGGSDESFAIDNLTVNLITADGNSVPEPGVLGLLGLGLAALAARRRKAA